MNGSDLLAQYRSTASEDAFTALVRRYANLVYSVAWRRLSNNALAEEAAQMVFTRLATVRPKIQSDPELVAWLHRTAVHVSIDLWRSETRRRTRELAAAMDAPATQTAQLWDEIAPHLDEALNELNDADRQVLLLRFFASKSMLEIGRVFAVSEDAAKMRVSRALERLRTQLLPRAAALTTVTLGTMVAERSIEAAPPALVLRLCSLHGAGTTSATVEPLLQTTRAKVIAAAGLAITVTLLLVSRGRQSDIDSTASQKQQEQTAPVTARRPLNSQRAATGNLIAQPLPSPNIRMLLRVLDGETDQALPGAHIRGTYFYAGGRGEPHLAVTDQNGEAAIPEPLEGGYPGMNLFVSVEGYVPKAISFPANVPAQYVFKAERAALVAGIVVDEAGAPVPDVAIQASSSEDYKDGRTNTDFQTTAVKTDSKGQFLYPYIPRSYDHVRFDLTCDGYAVTGATIAMRTADATNARLLIKRGFVIAGRVTDSEGAPIPNAKVSEFHNWDHRKLSTETDLNGEYLLLGVSSGDFQRKAEIVVQGDRMAPQLKTVELRNATNALNFVLARGTLFRGHVIDQAGQPITNAAVRTDSDNQGRQPFFWFTRTDDEGHFEWDSAPAQPVLFWFEADGYDVIRDLPLTPDGTEFEIKLKTTKKK